MYKICVFAPLDAAELIKSAMFAAGAGKLGGYDFCAFETAGTGQFRPLPGASPYIGSENQLCRVDELKIEMIVADEYIRDVVAAMKKAHPYEVPAYDVIKLVEL